MADEEKIPPAEQEQDDSTPAVEQENAPAEEPETTAPAPDEPKAGMSEAEIREKIEEHFRAQPVGEVLMQFLISLSTLAYVKMGITEDSKQYRDLQQARLAIDAFKALLDTAGPRLDSQDASALAGALASMQITFAKALEETG